MVMNIGWFNRIISRFAAESILYEMKIYNHGKLARIARVRDRDAYPWKNDPEGSRVFWQVYKEMVGEAPDGPYSARQH